MTSPDSDFLTPLPPLVTPCHLLGVPPSLRLWGDVIYGLSLTENVHFPYNFQMEVKKLQDEIDTEVRLRKDLDEKVAKMNQLLTTGQEALQQEKKTVEMLRQQIVSQTPTKVSFLNLETK